jgi:uncharacterized membrane protein
VTIGLECSLGVNAGRCRALRYCIPTGGAVLSKTRLEAFSDGVIAIIITIMVLELKIPHGEDFEALKPLIPVFLSYAMSFIFVGIYWNNHHHMLQIVEKVNGKILWANLHLLFWLSLIPFVTNWMGETGFASRPLAVYGAVILMCAIAYTILVLVLIDFHGANSKLAQALGINFKSKISWLFYIIGIPISFFNSWIALALYLSVSIIWLLPDRRIENVLTDET